MEAPSPGRKRIVIRSVAGPNAGGGSHSPIGFASGFRTSRMAISARADSEMPAWAASATKRSFSSGEGRAVIDGSGRVDRQATDKGTRGDFGARGGVMIAAFAPLGLRHSPKKEKGRICLFFQPNSPRRRWTPMDTAVRINNSNQRTCSGEGRTSPLRSAAARYAIGFTRLKADEQLMMTTDSGIGSSEGFCCKRGHSAILPLTQYRIHKCAG